MFLQVGDNRPVMAFVYMKPRPFYIKSTPPIQMIDIVYYSISLTRVIYPGGLATTVEVGGREYQAHAFPGLFHCRCQPQSHESEKGSVR